MAQGGAAEGPFVSRIPGQGRVSSWDAGRKRGRWTAYRAGDGRIFSLSERLQRKGLA